MRPAGEIRQALLSAAEAYPQGATWRQLGQAACVGFEAARITCDNLARAGELAVLGTLQVPGCPRPMRRYAPKGARGGWVTAGLGDVIAGWRR